MAQTVSEPQAQGDAQGSADSPATISGGHLVAKALKAEGVEVIFTLCGGHIIDIYDGCVDEGIDVVDVRHEQVAAHAADGYARVTGKPGCAVVTAGPGTTADPGSAHRWDDVGGRHLHGAVQGAALRGAE